MENPIRMDDMGVPLFLETPKYLESKKLDPQDFVGGYGDSSFF